MKYDPGVCEPDIHGMLYTIHYLRTSLLARLFIAYIRHVFLCSVENLKLSVRYVDVTDGKCTFLSRVEVFFYAIGPGSSSECNCKMNARSTRNQYLQIERLNI